MPAAYLAVTLGLTMFSMHPLLIALSFAGGLAYGACVRGWRTQALSLRWQLPVVLVIGLVNPLFVSMGSTELFDLFGRPVYAESLLYGCAMAGLFVASAQWFGIGSAMLSYDKVLGLLGNVVPTVALMVSMTMRMVPRFVRQGRTIAAVQDVALSCMGFGCTPSEGGVSASGEASASAPGEVGASMPEEVGASIPGEAGASIPKETGASMLEETGASATAPRRRREPARLLRARRLSDRVTGCPSDRMPVRLSYRMPVRLSDRVTGRLSNRVKGRLRQSSVLMGWAMEDSLETADAMRARGWGACRQRTTYLPYRFTLRDAAVLLVLTVAAAVCIWASWTATNAYEFYPRLTPICAWWGYVPYAAWMFGPAALHLYETRRFS